MKVARRSGSSILVMPSAMAASLKGCTCRAASPATSGMDVTLEVSTGVSHLNASRMGMPKPSKYDTYTEAKAAAVTKWRSSALSLPANTTSSLCVIAL